MAELVDPQAVWIGAPRFVARRPQAHPGDPAAETRVERRVGTLSSGRVVDFAEFAPLAPLVADPAVTDVFVNGPQQLWVDRGSGLEQLAPLALDETQLRDLAVRLIAAGGRHIDEASPCVDVRLRDGIRVHAVLPPISTGGTLLSIRLPAVVRPSVRDLDAAGFFRDVPLALVAQAVRERCNLLITGASGSGKTTLLAALLATAAPTDRIVAIEDVAELRVDHPHFVSLEARQANLEGAGAVGAQRLVREALRMRPDRLVVGECRGAEVRELLSALNTGHDGGGGTMHANTLGDVPARIEALGALGGLSPDAIARQAVSAIGIVLHLERRLDVRRLVKAGRLELDRRDRLKIEPLDPRLPVSAAPPMTESRP
ncbi:hypothetical protein GCM10027052_17860 [Parafrigoribacterium mesophilum]|uniref:TadA family conjugal transfer-associated ATPase n=1 Tax=Parafrigoribacterium mesophilum TaxID=433646 RepID=UPI0031FD459F